MEKSKRRFQRASERKGNSKGITLVALVITIIIIIILATVTINFAFGDSGLIKQAELARDLTANSTEYESQAMSNLVAYMNEIQGELGNSTDTVKLVDVKGGEAFDKKTTVEDEEGNKIEVPAGFKIASDSGNTVQQGVVIEDVNASTDTAVQGSQFVWIPVGKFTKDDGTESNEIILGRYTFADDAQGTPILKQAAYTEENPENYKNSKVIETHYNEYSGLHRDGTIDNSNHLNDLNATANDLGAWIDSVKTNRGYYIGRYEASYASGSSVENYKAATKVSTRFSEDEMSYNSGTLWNSITQLDASKVAINTYKESTSVKSDLMNSYAWDTAIVYIQECGNTNYANQNSKNSSLANTGTNNDEVCKINDMSSNISEWTTEYSSSTVSSTAYPCTCRGGTYVNSHNYTALRSDISATYSGDNIGFRLSLYM